MKGIIFYLKQNKDNILFSQLYVISLDLSLLSLQLAKLFLNYLLIKKHYNNRKTIQGKESNIA